jgi:predicted CXXCH cytochrome family protein
VQRIFDKEVRTLKFAGRWQEVKFFLRSCVRIISVLSALLLLTTSSGSAEEPNCLSCHEALATGKSIHPALSMGCMACHTGIDASDVPHKRTNKNPRGLAAKMRDLCFTCHDKAPFQKQTVHGAVILGCTSCHNPHASDHGRLLKEEVPTLCLGCHEDRFETGRARSHAPARNEMCIKCHDPHGADNPKLLVSGATTS